MRLCMQAALVYHTTVGWGPPISSMLHQWHSELEGITDFVLLLSGCEMQLH